MRDPLILYRHASESREWDRDFMRLQYEALRAEILATQRRAFQIMGAGIVGLPLLSYVIQRPTIISVRQAGGQTISAGLDRYVASVMLAVPFVVIVIALLWLADNNAIIRMGYFIRRYIERLTRVPGWESWLETNQRITRSTERYVVWAVYLLFGLYYFGALFLARDGAERLLSADNAVAITRGYGLMGIVVGIWFATNILPSTQRLDERLRRLRALDADPAARYNQPLPSRLRHAYMKKFPTRRRRPAA